MKTEAEVDALMRKIPETWRMRWCGGESGPCACMGCVQIGCKQIMLEHVSGTRFHGDPEYIDDSRFSEHVRLTFRPTREEWEAWRQRHGLS